MAKVTSKLQVTLPKAIATAHGIKPGDQIDWVSAGDAIRIVPSEVRPRSLSTTARLKLFDLATARQRQRERRRKAAPVARRGWTREDLYERGRSR